MINFISWLKGRLQGFSWLDFALMKIALVGFGLMIAALWPTLQEVPWYWFGIVFLAAYIWLLGRIFGRAN